MRLCRGGERPPDRSSAEKCDEITPPHAFPQRSTWTPEYQMSHDLTKAIAAVSRLNRQGVEGESPLRCRSSEPHRPRAVRQQWRSVGRGVHTLAIEPRKIV